MNTIELVIVIIATTANLILALFTLLKNPKSATNRLFFGLTFSLALYVLINHLTSYSQLSLHLFTIVKIILSLGLLINCFFFLLVDSFPHPKIQTSTKTIILILFYTLIVAVLIHLNLVFTHIEYTPEGSNSIPGPAMPLFFIHTVGLLGLGTITLLKKTKKTTGIEKRQLQFLQLGTITMFSLILLTNLLLVVIFNTNTLVGLLPLYTTIFVGSVSYAIIKHRLLDINSLVARTVAFTLLTLIIIIIYTIGLFTIPQLFPSQFHSPLYIILALILAFTYNPLRSLLENSTEKIFHKKAYHPEEVLETLSDHIRSTLSIQTITQSVHHQLHHSLHPTSMAFFLRDRQKKSFEPINFGYKQLPDLKPQDIRLLAQKAGSSILVYEEVSHKKTRQLLRDNQISLVVPLIANKTLIGILVLGPKSSGDIYTSQDINVLEIAGPQISIAIQNSLAYDEIKKFNVTLRQKIKQATANLRQANRELRHLDKLKDEFVYIATHELKTPVTVMKGYLSMINEGDFGKIPPKLSQPLQEINAANAQLIQLVNDLLEIARAEAKTLTIETQPVNLCQTIDNAISSLKTLADQKHLKLVHSCSRKDTAVKADPDRLKEILNNLISNAIKYSHKGTITISHLTDKKVVVAHVADQGVGISATDQKHIFTRFFRAEEQAGKVPGTGLGLFIVKQLVEKMGGKIWFTSELGKGTTFSFALPKA